MAAQQLPQPPAGYGPSGADVVVDAAGVLSPATIARINSLAWELRQKTGGELAVVTLPDLGGRDPAEVALRIGREWGVGASAPIGSRVRNAGVVVLVVPKETSADGRGHVRIEVGRGAEGFPAVRSWPRTGSRPWSWSRATGSAAAAQPTRWRVSISTWGRAWWR